MKYISIILIILLISVNSKAYPENKKYPFDLGISYMYSESIYKGVDNNIIILPYVSYENKYIYLKGAVLGYKIFKNRDFKINIINKYSFKGYEEDDSIYFKNMHKKEKTIETGITLKYSINRKYNFQLNFLHDICDKHNSYRTDLNFSYRRFIDRILLISNIGVEFMPEKYGNYYYGVGSDETNLYTYYYNVGNSINWFTGINFIYLHSKKVSFICNIIYKFYDKNIYKSPIIHNKNRLTLISGINIKL